MNESIDVKIKKLNRFRFLKLAGVSFVISILLIVFGVAFEEELNDLFPVMMILAFMLFFVDFGLLIAFAASITKKEAIVRQLIIDEYWNKKLNTWTYDHADHFLVTSKRQQDQRYLTHPMIVNYSSEQFYYTLSNQSKDIHLHALRYTHQVSTGKGSSQAIDFSGYLIETKHMVPTDLYIRKWDMSEKFKAYFMIQKPDQIEDNTGINGPYDDIMKTLRNKLLGLGFKDVILLEQNEKLTILCEEFRLIPKMMKQKETNDDLHRSHLMKLISVIDDILEAYPI